jgi:hypothetical protein
LRLRLVFFGLSSLKPRKSPVSRREGRFGVPFAFLDAA